MPNVLVLSFEGFSFSSRQLYQHLLPKLLSRAAVHESVTVQDALSYVLAGWPNIIIVTDPVIADETEQSSRLLGAVAESTRHGCITLLAGFFISALDHARMNTIFKDYFDLKWQVLEEADQTVQLRIADENLIRRESLFQTFNTRAVFLEKVPPHQMIYSSSSGPLPVTHAAYARVGLGKLGYNGDTDFGEESERLMLAFTHLDRSEDSFKEFDL